MAVDLSVFDRIKTKADFDRESEEFRIRKLAAMKQAQGSSPAAVQIADEIAKARAAGDLQRVNDLVLTHKMYDKGVYNDPNGNPMAIQGYGDAVGSIEGAKSLYKQNAQNQSDLVYKPAIERDVQTQKSNVELGYSQPIEEAKATGKAMAEATAAVNKKATSAKSMLGLTDQAREILNTGNPTGSYAGAGLALGKRVFGVSDETTQANAALDALAGNLTASVPRMEGPQSNFDVQNYEKMAGRVNDKTLPIEDRLAALDEIDRIQSKYAHLNVEGEEDFPRLSVEDLEDPMAASRNAVMERNAQGIQNPNQTLPQPAGQPAAPKPGQVVSGYIFMGGSPADQKNWKKK